MKSFLIYLSLLTASVSLFGQSCLPGDNYFYSQTDIDNFYTNHPNCTTIEGDLMITGPDITSLSGLQNITTFESGFWVEECPLLESFTGLDNVTYIGDYLEIGNLPLIENFNELSNLSYVGGALNIVILPSLVNLNGLENVTSSPTYLIIWGNSNLTNLDGLNNIQSISTSLKLRNNTVLNDISALENIDLSVLTYLTFKGNSQLSICNINSICDALDNGVTEFTIENNGSGCNTIGEIENSCATSIEEIRSDVSCFYPNPTKSEIIFNKNQNKNIKIFNQIGQLVFSQKNVTTKLNVSDLLIGMYFIRIEYSNRTIEKKLIIN